MTLFVFSGQGFLFQYFFQHRFALQQFMYIRRDSAVTYE